MPIHTKPKGIVGTPPSRPLTIDMTCRIGLATRGVTARRKARRAVQTIIERARQVMRTEEVLIDPKLNSFIWHKGIKAVPRRVRVRMIRQAKRGVYAGKDMFYTLVEHVPCESYSRLRTEKVEDDVFRGAT